MLPQKIPWASVRILLLTLLVLVCLPFVTYGGYRLWRYYFWSGFQVPVNERLSRSNGALNRLQKDHLSKYRDSINRSDILFVSIDTLRADHLPIYGYPKQTAPFLTRFAKDSSVFDRAYASSSVTAPSHSTMFTGLYPLQNGVVTNSHAMTEEITTLPEILRNNGYRTAAFVSTRVHFEPANLDQGFGHFNNPEPTEMVYDPPGPNDRLNREYRSAERTLSKARTFVENYSGTEPLFVWVHLFDPHQPLTVRSKHLDKIAYIDRNRREQYFQFVKDRFHLDLRNGEPAYGPHENNWLAYYRLYDSEIHYTDRQLKQFYDSFRTVRGEPFTVITADHGEGLGNHKYWGHGKHLYNEQIRVPLIINDPSNKLSSGRVNTVVELADLMPTILNKSNLSWDEVYERRSLPVEGVPLQMVVSEENGFDRSKFGWAFSQRQSFAWPGMIDRAKDFYFQLTTNSKYFPFTGRMVTNYEPGETYSLIGPGGKYIHKTAYLDEFYEINNDFYEQENLIDKSSRDAVQLGSTISSVVDTLKKTDVPDARRLETSSGLKALGYVN